MIELRLELHTHIPGPDSQQVYICHPWFKYMVPSPPKTVATQAGPWGQPSIRRHRACSLHSAIAYAKGSGRRSQPHRGSINPTTNSWEAIPECTRARDKEDGP